MDSVALRVFIYDRVVATGTPPLVREIAAVFGVPVARARRALATLNIGKTVLVDPDKGEVWMAGPFAAVPTPYRVVGGRTTWWANCAWDMLGIPIIAGERVRIEARCEHCLGRMTMDAFPDRPPAAVGVVHVLVPARAWYEDIGYT